MLPGLSCHKPAGSSNVDRDPWVNAHSFIPAVSIPALVVSLRIHFKQPCKIQVPAPRWYKTDRSLQCSWNSYPLDLIFREERFVFHPGLCLSKPPGLMMTTMPGPLRETLNFSTEHTVSMVDDPGSTTKGQGHDSGKGRKPHQGI